MQLSDIIKKYAAPPLYEPGTAFMWTDKHISKQLLNIHLDPDLDLASRKKSTIEKTADWILSTQKPGKTLKILDLGCGPGLYSEIFSQKGHDVTGIDISEVSIEYARKSAQEKKLEITYKKASYLDITLQKETYDLVVMIFTDFGVLKPQDRKNLLDKVHQSLKKSGIFIFDVLADKNLHDKIAPKKWEASQNGFWRPTPYLALSQSFLYKEQKVILYQHLVIESLGKTEDYRFWTQYYSTEDLKEELKPVGFSKTETRDDILPHSDKWNGDNVLFCVALK